MTLMIISLGHEMARVSLVYVYGFLALPRTCLHQYGMAAPAMLNYSLPDRASISDMEDDHLDT